MKKTIKVTAISLFHNSLSDTFRVDADGGCFQRRVKSSCGGSRDGCCCGYPVSRTEWECPEGYTARAEWDASDGGIIIYVERVGEEA